MAKFCYTPNNMRVHSVRLSIKLLSLSLWLAAGCVVDSPMPYVAMYDWCFSVEDCEPIADACYAVILEDSSGTMCSRTCLSDNDCPDDGACYILLGDATERSVCYARCYNDDSYCYPDFECAAAEVVNGPDDFICVPS